MKIRSPMSTCPEIENVESKLLFDDPFFKCGREGNSDPCYLKRNHILEKKLKIFVGFVESEI